MANELWNRRAVTEMREDPEKKEDEDARNITDAGPADNVSTVTKRWPVTIAVAHPGPKISPGCTVKPHSQAACSVAAITSETGGHTDTGVRVPVNILLIPETDTAGLARL